MVNQCSSNDLQKTSRSSYLVNDGSTDGSELLADRWRARYPTTVQVVHQESAGLSAARNTRADHTDGKYLAFLDV